MGRAYVNELDELAGTYEWAATADIGAISRAVARAAQQPLVAVGSGGSLTTASLMTLLHQRYAAQVALTTTPVQLTATLPFRARASTWIISAGGRNRDIRGALRAAAELEPSQLVVLCGSPKSALVRETAERTWVDCLPVALPSKDGFLSTNSALAFAVLLARAYTGLAGERLRHDTLESLEAETVRDRETLVARCRPLWDRPTLIVLHGAATLSLAVDLESRFTEAALGVVQLADFRNFAHGRHHWLAKHGESSAVLALVTRADEDLARATMRLLPETVPSATIEFAGEMGDVLMGALATGMRIAGHAGAARGIDPGRPGVPEFGRKLYQLAERGRRGVASDDQLSPQESVPIRRKTRCTIATLRDRAALGFWREALAVFGQRLATARFNGLVCDYDGTLIGRDRDAPPDAELSTTLAQLLRAGIPIGIATGRGDSICGPLRAAIPEEHWRRVLIGYHNGAVARTLNECPALDQLEVVPAIATAHEVLRSARAVTTVASLRANPDQITVASHLVNEDHLWMLVSEAIRRAGVEGLSVLRSSHSVDVIPIASSKVRVIDGLRELTGGGKILSIGDRGCWPGNDHDLLGGPDSLSVDEVSPEPESAWNLAVPGARGVDALRGYLRGVAVDDGWFRLTFRGSSA